MKNLMKIKWQWVAISCSLLAIGGQAMASQQIGSAVTNLTQRYEHLIRVPDNDPATGGDLQIHCLSLVFKNWSKAYLDILDRTDIDPSTVGAPLMAFGKKWFSAEDNLKVAEYFRPGVNEVLVQVIGSIREEDRGPDRLDPSRISLGDVVDSLYFSNLKVCLDDRFVERALKLLKPVDASSQLPPGLLRSPHGSVSWVRTPSNGIKPVWNEPVSLVSALFRAGTIENDGITYLEYLTQFQAQ